MLTLALLAAPASAADVDIQEVCASLLAGPDAVQEHLDLRAFEPDRAASPRDVRRWLRHGGLASVLSAQARRAGVAASVVTADADTAQILIVGRDGPFYLDLELGRDGRISDWQWTDDSASASARLSVAAAGGADGLNAMYALQGYVVAAR